MIPMAASMLGIVPPLVVGRALLYATLSASTTNPQNLHKIANGIFVKAPLLQLGYKSITGCAEPIGVSDGSLGADPG
jgi:hypothetical protein